jgi:hypothetical protein
MTGSNLWTDGNALAGPLHDVFRPDVTAAVGGCGNCGRIGPMRLVRGPGRAWLDLGGLTYLQLPMAEET